MPSFESANEILLGRKRLIFPGAITRNRDRKRGVETYDLTALFPAAGLSGFQVNGNTIAPVGGIINLPVNNDLIFSAGAIRQGGTYVVDTVSNLAGLNRGYTDGVRRVSFKGANIRQMITSTGERSVVDGFTVYYDNPQAAGYTKDVRYRNAALGGFQWFVNGDDGLSGLDITGAVPTSGNGGMKIDKGGRLGVYNPTSTADLGDLGDFGGMPWQGINYSNKRRAYFSTGGVQINHTGGDNAMGTVLLWLNHNRSWMFRQGEGAGAATELDFLSEGGSKTTNLAGCQEPLTAVPTYSRFLTTIAHQNNNDNDHQVILGRQEISAQTTHPYVGVKADGVTPKNTWFRARSYTGQQIGGNATRALMDLDTSIGFAVTAVDTATATVYTPTTNDTVIEVNLTTAGLLFTPPSAASCPRRFICLNIVNPSPTNNIVIDPLGGNIDGGATRTILGNRKSKIWMYSNTTEWKVLLTDEGIRVDNTLFVDGQYGNNTTALRESFDLPFATVAGAEAAALAGDTIVIRNIGGMTSLQNATISKNLNIVTDPGAVINSSVRTIGTNITTRITGVNVNKVSSAGNNILLQNGSVVYLDGHTFQSDSGGLFGRVGNSLVTGAEAHVRFKQTKGSHLATGASFFQMYDCTNCKFNMECDLWEADTSLIAIRIAIGNTVNLTCNDYNPILSPTQSARFISWADGNGSNGNIVHVKAKKLNWPSTFNFFMKTGDNGWNNRMVLDADYLTCVRAVLINTCMQSETICRGIKWSSSSENFMWHRSPLSAVGGFTGKSKVYFDVQFAENTFNASTSVSGYGSHQGMLIAIQDGNQDVYITSKELKSAKNEIIGLDGAAVALGTPQLGTTDLYIYGTKFIRSGKDAGLGYEGIIFIDKPSDPSPAINIHLYNGVVAEAIGTDYFIAGVNNSALQFVNLYHYTEPLVNDLINSSVNRTHYMHNKSVTISAGGTYTLGNTTDGFRKNYFYDLNALGNLTFVLPNHADYIDYEVNLKITSTHPTSIVTIDPAGASTIDGNLTLVIPNTSTSKVNVVMQATATGWFLKG